MVAVKSLYLRAKDEFDKAGIDAPAFNSLALIEKVYGLTKTQLLTEKHFIEDSEAVPFITLVGRRLSGEPLQYLLGEWEFYGIKLKVGNGVLIPRDDTEVLLRDCLYFLKSIEKPRVLDLCTGSGALAIAIEKNTDSEVIAVEKSADALPYLCENISLNESKVSVVADDVFDCADEFPDGYFDLILSNPPYVKSAEIETLQKEIAFEPKMALDGGEDGLEFYRFITKVWKTKLKKGGRLAFELGEGQFDAVKTMLEAENFGEIGGSLDLGGIQRTINGTLL